MRVLVTGGAGFVGRHLVDLALEGGSEVWSLDRSAEAPPGATVVRVDLADTPEVRRAVAEIRPDRVVHLAGRTPANAPSAEAGDWLGGDPAWTLGLLEAIRSVTPAARVLVVSSSAVYGHVPEDAQPISEEAPLEPLTLYGIAKAGVELVAVRFHRAFGLHVVRARPFNLVGPGEHPAMLTSTLAAQVAGLAGDASGVIRMRHRATSRDYTDVRDAVRAYWMLLEEGVPGEAYNVCTGRAVAIGHLAARLLDLAGLETSVEETASGPAAGDVTTQAGDHSKLTRATGWSPTISLERSLGDLLASLSD